MCKAVIRFILVLGWVLPDRPVLSCQISSPGAAGAPAVPDALKQGQVQEY